MEFKKPINRRAKPAPVAPPQPKPLPITPAAKPRTSSLARIRPLTKRILIIAGIIIILVVGGLLIRLFFTHSAMLSPKYQTISPGGIPIEQLGGWKRVSPPEKDPVFAYSDMIDGVNISVSQQPLPVSFEADPAGKTAELAKSYSATNKIEADKITIYIGTSVKGPQSVIFTKTDLLVLIKSEKKLSDASWKRYIESLADTGSASSNLPKY